MTGETIQTRRSQSDDRARDSDQADQFFLLAGVALLLVLYFWVFWDFFFRQVEFAIKQQADWGHTLVIPLIACYFVYLARNKILAQPLQRAWLGLLLVVVGVLWYGLCTFTGDSLAWLRHHNLMGLGVGISTLGLILLFCGYRAFIWIWFPLLFLFVFGQTISDRFLSIITFRMQDIAAGGAFFTLKAMGNDVTLSGNTLELFSDGESRQLNVAEACSGMRMLMAFLALGVAMAYLGLKRFWQQALLVLSAFPTAILVNILRVVTLSLLSTFDAGFAAGDFHSIVGLLWLIPAYLIFLGELWIIKNLIIENESETKTVAASKPLVVRSHVRRSGIAAFVIACLTLAISAISIRVIAEQLNVHLRKESIRPRLALASLPPQLGAWHKVGDDAVLSEEMIESLGSGQFLTRTYALDDKAASSKLALHVVYYTGQIDAVPHVPDRCFVAGGYEPQTSVPENIDLNIDQSEWVLLDEGSKEFGHTYPQIQRPHPVTGDQETIRLPLGDLKLRTSEFRHPGMGEIPIFAGYFFLANGQVAVTPSDVHRFAFDLSSKYSYYCKVQITAVLKQGEDKEIFVSRATDFLDDLLPQLMRCLPDWFEVETGSYPETIQ